MAFQDFVEEASVRRRAFEEQGNPGPILVAAGLYKDGKQVFLPADPGLDLADPSRHGLLRGFRDERVVRRQNLNWKTLNDDVLSFLYRAMFAQKCDLRLERDDSSIRLGGGKEDEDVQVERRDRLRVEEGSHRSPDGIAVQKASGDHLVQQANRGFHQTAFRTTDYGPNHLPRDRDGIPRDLLVTAHENEVLDLSLCDENPVERVPVMVGQRRDVQRVPKVNRQDLKAVGRHVFGHEVFEVLRQPQRPILVLIASSQALATLRKTSFRSPEINFRALAGSLGSSPIHQRNACVSSSGLTIRRNAGAWPGGGRRNSPLS